MEHGHQYPRSRHCDHVPNFRLSRNCRTSAGDVTLEESGRCQGFAPSDGLHFDSVHERQQVSLRHQGPRHSRSHRSIQRPSVDRIDIILKNVLSRSTNFELYLRLFNLNLTENKILFTFFNFTCINMVNP